MKDIFFRLLVAAALTLAAFALSSSAHGQQADGGCDTHERNAARKCTTNLPIPQRHRLDAPAYRLLPRDQNSG